MPVPCVPEPGLEMGTVNSNVWSPPFGNTLSVPDAEHKVLTASRVLSHFTPSQSTCDGCDGGEYYAHFTDKESKSPEVEETAQRLAVEDVGLEAGLPREALSLSSP